MWKHKRSLSFLKLYYEEIPPPQTINSLVWLLNCEGKTLTFSFSSQDKQVSQDVLQYLSNRAYGTCCSTHFRVAQRQMETFEWQMVFYL